jgi:RNA-splicing ligase RtcB
MKTIRGKHNEAVVFTDQVEGVAEEQIKQLCDQEFAQGSRIRIMPDAHAGAGCTIGTTMTIADKVVPNIVGVDIGCGMLVHQLKQKKADFAAVDQVIRAHVPSGFDVRKKPHAFAEKTGIEKLQCLHSVGLERARLSVGTLGGGNHFIELDRDDEGALYLVIHSGSRHLGKQIAEHYQHLAARSRNGCGKGLEYLEGDAFRAYIHDMKIAQHYATTNRLAMAQVILSETGLVSTGSFTTVHNYIDTDTMILRKGAISAKRGENVLIPMNMRDGSIIAVGKGNENWNQSAPHGAGRLMSRRQALRTLSMEEFKASMAGIFTTTLTKDTLDEAPAAYKPMADIVECMKETVEIVKLIRPVYNFKATGD